MQDVQGSNATFRLLFWPRSTMRWILEHDPNYGVMLVGMFIGITAMLRSSVLHGLHPAAGFVGLHPLVDAVIAYGIGPSAGFPMTIVSLAVIGGMIGVVAVYLGTMLLLLASRAVGGSGGFIATRAALTWSFVPYSWLLPLWLGHALLNWSELRSVSYSFAPTFPWDLSGALMWLLLLDYTVRALGLILLTLKISVAQQLPLRQALAAVLLTFTIPGLLLVPWQGFGF